MLWGSLDLLITDIFIFVVILQWGLLGLLLDENLSVDVIEADSGLDGATNLVYRPEKVRTCWLNMVAAAERVLLGSAATSA